MRTRRGRGFGVAPLGWKAPDVLDDRGAVAYGACADAEEERQRRPDGRDVCLGRFAERLEETSLYGMNAM